MPDNQIEALRRFVDLQVAAESVFGIDPRNPAFPPRPGSVVEGPEILIAQLESGNNRSSRFPTVLATEFVKQFQLVEHLSNTETGFSGTLFRYVGPDDKSSGLKKGDKVLSFRSTEFADDAVRENQATNVGEIQAKGWAFGQIADMQAWYEQLAADPAKLGDGSHYYVTGYSLGGHLATAFRLMREGDGSAQRIEAVYTLNGAGVGKVVGANNAVSTGSRLLEIANQFRQESGVNFAQPGVRERPSITFTNARVASLYADLHGIFNQRIESFKDTSTIQGITPQIAAAFNRWFPSSMIIGQSTFLVKSVILQEARLIDNDQLLDERSLADVRQILDAVARIATILNEGARVATIKNGVAPPAEVPPYQVAGIRLDYQMAVLNAAKSTQAYRTGPIDAGLAAMLPEAPVVSPALDRMFDVSGDTSPSGVANSQLHYGKQIKVYIEDQPLARGSILRKSALASTSFSAPKLLVDDFSKNDFGDTHSLVLMVDSLSVASALVKLDPTFTLVQMSALFHAAGNKRASLIALGQGSAEGNTLEAVLDGLRKLFMGALGFNPTPFDLTGGTWAEIVGRNKFHDNLSDLTKSSTFQQSAGKVRISASVASAQQASENFTDFMTLHTLTPFRVSVVNSADSATLAAIKAANAGLAQLWDADRVLTAGERATGKARFSTDWLQDRSEMLSWMAVGNAGNIAYDTTGRLVVAGTSGQARRFDDRASNLAFSVSNHVLYESEAGVKRITFGSALNETLSGADAADRLYGAGGDDILTGKQGNDYFEGGIGADTYFYKAGDGADIIAELNTTGDQLLIGGNYDNPQAGYLVKGRAGVVNPSKFGYDSGRRVFVDSENGLSYQLIAGANGSNRLLVFGQKLGGGVTNSITIENFKSGKLGIDLPNEIKLDVGAIGGAKTGALFDADRPPSAQAVLTEGGIRNFTVAVTEPFRAGQKIKLELSGGDADILRLSTGAEQLAFSNGSLILDASAGRDALTFALYVEGDPDSDSVYQIKATLIDPDAEADATVLETSLAFTLDATDEPDPGTNHTNTPGTDNPDLYGAAQYTYNAAGESSLTEYTHQGNNSNIPSLYTTDLGVGNDYYSNGAGFTLIDRVHGGAGNDFITLTGAAAGPGFINTEGRYGTEQGFGDAGDDYLFFGGRTGGGEAYGGDGDDILRADADTQSPGSPGPFGFVYKDGDAVTNDNNPNDFAEHWGALQRAFDPTLVGGPADTQSAGQPGNAGSNTGYSVSPFAGDFTINRTAADGDTWRYSYVAQTRVLTLEHTTTNTTTSTRFDVVDTIGYDAGNTVSNYDFDGGAGNDDLITSAGTDQLDGGAGDDRLFGMGGEDALSLAAPATTSWPATNPTTPA